jgi:hypothetical protein
LIVLIFISPEGNSGFRISAREALASRPGLSQGLVVAASTPHLM